MKLAPLLGLCVIALMSAGGAPIDPPVALEPRVYKPESAKKVVYYQIDYNPARRKAVPEGCVPYVVDGGGRFIDKWGREQSWWVGGYYGVGANRLNGNRPTGERWLHPIPELVKEGLSSYAPGTLYVLDQEELPLDARVKSDWEVEDSIRKIRAFFAAARAARPDMRFAIYSVIPLGDFWVMDSHGRAMAAVEKAKRDPTQMIESDWWWASQVANVVQPWQPGGKPSGVYLGAMDETGHEAVRWKALQAANTRLTYGLRDNGEQDDDAGLTDAVDVMAPSCYDATAGDDSGHYIRASVDEARRIGGERQVAIFAWHKYHESNAALGNKPIPLDEWRVSVRQMFESGDAVILWDTNLENAPDHVKVVFEERDRMNATLP